MLKGNLSTRPFYNDRTVTAAIALAALVVLAITIVNVMALYTLSAERRTQRARVDADNAEATRIRAEAQSLQQALDRPTLAGLASSAAEANRLIDERTFSWTSLLGVLERTLPPDVRLTAISPRLDQGAFRVSMAVVARELDHIDDFIIAMRETGELYDVAPTEQRRNDDGTYTVQMPEGWVSPAQAARERAVQTAARLAVGPLLADETLTGSEIQVLAALYDAWEPGTAYALGDVVQHDGALWEVRQAHTSQVGWEPGQVLALFHRYRGADEGDGSMDEAARSDGRSTTGSGSPAPSDRNSLSVGANGQSSGGVVVVAEADGGG